MTPFSDSQLLELLSGMIALIAGGFLIAYVVRSLTRSRPGLAIGYAIAAAFLVRILAAFGLEQTPFAGELRGGDELTFLERARDVAATGLGADRSVDAFTDQFHTFFFSLNYRMLPDAPEMMLRFEVIGLAVVGLALLSAAVYELAGPKPALIAAWLLALEPTVVFFSGILHKEPFMFLAEGMVVFGGAVLWKRGDLTALIPMVTGCAIATATRPYVGWFLAAAAAVVVLHASLRRGSPSRSLALSAVVVALIVALVPIVWSATSNERLKELQASQDANILDDDANLALEEIDYSSRGRVVANLPKRVRDVVFRPYPWQVENTSQQLGVIGTLVMLVGLVLLMGALVQEGGAVMARAGPFVYAALFLLVAYSLSAGNAGTAFRYRTHVVGILLCLLLVLRQRRLEARAQAARRPRVRPRRHLSRRRATA